MCVVTSVARRGYGRVMCVSMHVCAHGQSTVGSTVGTSVGETVVGANVVGVRVVGAAVGEYVLGDGVNATNA